MVVDAFKVFENDMTRKLLPLTPFGAGQKGQNRKLMFSEK